MELDRSCILHGFQVDVFFFLPQTVTALGKVFHQSVKTILQQRLKLFFFSSIFFSNDFLNCFLDSPSLVLTARAVLCSCYCHFTQTTNNHWQVEWNKKTATWLSDTLQPKLWTWSSASQCAIASLHAHASLRFLSRSDALNPWSGNNKGLFTFCVLVRKKWNHKEKKKKEAALKLSSLIRRGAAALIRAWYPPGAGPDNLAQQLLPPRVTVPVLDMQNPANSDSATARWKVCCRCCSKSCSTINPPRCSSACLFACTQAHVHVRQGRAPSTQAMAGAHEKWASSRCKLGETRRRRGDCDWWFRSGVKRQQRGIQCDCKGSCRTVVGRRVCDG